MTVQRPQVGRAPQLTWAARNPEEGVVPFLLSGKQVHGSAGRKVWLLDFDDTLFASSAGLLHEVHLRMNAFMTERMGMSEEEANRLRSHYWQTYGSTFIGLWRRHGVDPKVFLPAVHDFDYAPFVQNAPQLRRLLAKLPGRRVLYSNGPRLYVERLLPALGLRNFFHAIVSSTDMRLFGDWRPKPNVSMLRAVCARLKTRPADAVLVDDSLMNLKAGKAAGLATVWCVGLRRKHAGLLLPAGTPAKLPEVDLVVRNVEDLVRRAHLL